MTDADLPACTCDSQPTTVLAHARGCPWRVAFGWDQVASRAPRKGLSAREDLLQTFADWGLTTGRGSRVHADRILTKNSTEQNERVRIAETELRTLRSGLRAIGGDPTQIQNLWAQIHLRNRQWRQAKAEIERLTGLLAESACPGEGRGCDCDCEGCGHHCAAHQSRGMKLVNLADAGRIMGVTRQRATQLSEREDFPRPVGHTGRGAVWAEAEVRAYHARRDTRPGRRPKEDS